MDNKEFISMGSALLTKAGIDTARLDVEVLLSDLLNRDRSWIISHPEHVLSRSDIQTLQEQVNRRSMHEPLAYIRGKQEFYGRDFLVTPDVLNPRPETEAMLELLLKSMPSDDETNTTLVDIGTGSGCIIISAYLELMQLGNNNTANYSFIGVDISKPALTVAQQNASTLHAEVEFQYFDLFKSDVSKYKTDSSELILLANLPYVPDAYPTNKATGFEPDIALFSGADGLEAYNEIFRQIQDKSGITIYTESLFSQQDVLVSIAAKHGYQLIAPQDLIQVFRSTV